MGPRGRACRPALDVVRSGMATVSEIDMAPRAQGRAAKGLTLEFVRELGEGDLALLATERGTKTPAISRLRDRHHALARVLASGMSDAEASMVTGYCPSRISILKSDPSFKDLLSSYRNIEAGAAADFGQRATVLTLTAMDNIQEMLEADEGGDIVPIGMQLEIAKTFSDRTGHAPLTKTMNINANVDLGSRIEKARARLAALSAPVDAEFTVIEPPG